MRSTFASHAPQAPHPARITGCVLAGGRGSRMGGVDKGLQLFRGQPLTLHALQRLAPQVGPLLVNANRHLEQYAQLAQAAGAQVCTDPLPDYPGPLAGFLAALTHCQTPWLLCIPCDAPLFPADLVERMVAAYADASDLAPEIIMAHGPDTERGLAPDHSAAIRPQPVFSLLHTSLKDSLQRFITSGGRKIDAWTGQHRCAAARFERPEDTIAFSNANTLEQLEQLERLKPPDPVPRP